MVVMLGEVGGSGVSAGGQMKAQSRERSGGLSIRAGAAVTGGGFLRGRPQVGVSREMMHTARHEWKVSVPFVTSHRADF